MIGIAQIGIRAEVLAIYGFGDDASSGDVESAIPESKGRDSGEKNLISVKNKIDTEEEQGRIEGSWIRQPSRLDPFIAT